MTVRVRQDAPAKKRLAGFWNAWFSKSEIDAAHRMAETATEDECRIELARLEKERNARLERWRMTQ